MQTNPQHLEEELQNTNIRNTIKVKQLPLPNQDDCKTKRTQSTEKKKQASNIEPPQTMGTTITNELTTKELPP